MVKITDFGVAHAVGAAPVTATGMVMGTPGYIAPERVSGAQAQPPSDLSALGIVAYECLTGAQPFTGSPLEVALAHRDRPLPPLPAWVPAEALELVMRLTAKDPAWRPASAAEVAAWAGRLRDDLRGGPPDGPGAGPDAAWFVPVAVPDVPVAGQPEPPPGLLAEPSPGLLAEPPGSTVADARPPVPGGAHLMIYETPADHLIRRVGPPRPVQVTNLRKRRDRQPIRLARPSWSTAAPSYAAFRTRTAPPPWSWPSPPWPPWSPPWPSSWPPWSWPPWPPVAAWPLVAALALVLAVAALAAALALVIAALTALAFVLAALVLPSAALAALVLALVLALLVTTHTEPLLIVLLALLDGVVL